MPRLKHFYDKHHVHYLTANTYRKARIFGPDRTIESGTGAATI